MKIVKKISIIGSGSWGVALAIHLAKLGNKVKIWSFEEEEANLINNEKMCKFLPEVVIPDGIYCTTSYEEAIQGSEYILHVTPSKFTRNTVKEYKRYVTNQTVIICTKGFEKDTLYTLDEVLKEEMPNVNLAVLSGPSHAEEVSKGIPTLMVISSENMKIAEDLQDIFMSETLRVYTSEDMKGIELGGALKNIIAFCAGVAAGIGLGDNTFAALITRGMTEISKLGVTLGGKKQTFYGLTGLGDLVVTCLSEHSRNRTAGILIGQGKSLEEAKKQIGMVIEGVDNIEVAYELSKKYNVEVPIIDAVYNMLHNGLKPVQAVNMLMTRDKKAEDI